MEGFGIDDRALHVGGVDTRAGDSRRGVAWIPLPARESNIGPHMNRETLGPTQGEPGGKLTGKGPSSNRDRVVIAVAGRRPDKARNVRDHLRVFRHVAHVPAQPAPHGIGKRPVILREDAPQR